jgi:hypothetical protein
MLTTATAPRDTPFGAPSRPLTEDVLQSAEEAVLTNPASVETLQDEEPVPEPDMPPANTPRRTDRLARIVAHRPFQSALAALLAGALAAALVKLALSRRD